MKSNAEVQIYQSEGSAPLDTNTPSSSHTATPTPSGSRTATPTPAAEGPPKKKHKKITKVEKAEKTANEVLERVLKERQVLAK